MSPMEACFYLLLCFAGANDEENDINEEQLEVIRDFVEENLERQIDIEQEIKAFRELSEEQVQKKLEKALAITAKELDYKEKDTVVDYLFGVMMSHDEPSDTDMELLSMLEEKWDFDIKSFMERNNPNEI